MSESNADAVRMLKEKLVAKAAAAAGAPLPEPNTKEAHEAADFATSMLLAENELLAVEAASYPEPQTGNLRKELQKIVDKHCP